MTQFFASIMQLSDLELQQSTELQQSLVKPQRQPMYTAQTSEENLVVEEQTETDEGLSNVHANKQHENNVQQNERHSELAKQDKQDSQIVVQKQQKYLQDSQTAIEPLVQQKQAQQQELQQEVNLIQEVIVPMMQQQKNVAKQHDVNNMQEKALKNDSQALLLEQQANTNNQKQLLPEITVSDQQLLPDVNDKQASDDSAVTENDLTQNFQQENSQPQTRQQKQQQAKQEQQDINISIGKIEVHAAQQNPVTPLSSKPTENKKHLSLDDYVQQRLRGQR